MLKYEKSFTFDQNVNDLADHLAGKVRALEDERNMVATSPNAPQLREVKLAAIDLKLATLRLHAEAAAMGVIFHDPRDVSGCDPAVSAWVSKARELGRLVNPTNFGPSLHDSRRTCRSRSFAAATGA